MVPPSVLLLLTAACYVHSNVDLTQPSSMVIKPGHSLTLTCKVSGYSLSTCCDYATAWIRQPAGKALEWITHIYGDGDIFKAESLKSKFSISKDPSSSTVPLRGQNMQAEDSGVYYCARYYDIVGDYAFDRWGKGTLVTVSNANTAEPTLFPLVQCEPGSDGLLTYACVATGFFPDHATFQWTKNGQDVVDAVQYPSVMKESKYSKTSQITVNSADMGTQQDIRCNLKYGNSPQKDLQKTFPFKAPPRSPDVTLLPVFTFESQNVLCFIEKFYPKSLTVTWKADNRTIKSEMPEIIQTDASGYYTAQSFLQLNTTTVDKNILYTCEVYHSMITIKRTKRLEGHLSVELTPPSSREIFINNTAVLRCITSGTDSKAVNDAQVTWKVGGKDQSSKASEEKNMLGNGQSRKISTLEVNVEDWFSGKEIECSVSDKYSEVKNSPLKTSIKKGVSAPDVFIYTLSEAKDPKFDSMVCEVRGSSLGDVYIMWQENGGDYKEGKTGVLKQDDGSMSLVSILTVKSETSESRRFTCAVKHGGMDSNTAPKLANISKSNYKECPVTD